MSKARPHLASALLLASLGVSAACGSDVTPSSTGTGGGDAQTSSGSTSGAGGGGGGQGGGVEEELLPAPGGVRRLLPEHIRSSIGVILGDAAEAAVGHVPDVPALSGFAAIGASEIALSPTDVSELETVSIAAATAAVQRRDRLAQLAPCVGAPSPPSSCYEDVAREVGRVAWRRPLDAEERGRLVAVAQAGQAWATREGLADPFGAGLQYELMALLQSPYFLYLVEIGEPVDGVEHRRELSGHELVSRISFFVHGRTPTKALLDAADAGELDTPEGVRAIVRAMLEREEARGSLDAFYEELFALDELGNLSKDPELFPEFSGELTTSMRDETLRFLRDLVWERRADAREMFVARETFVDEHLAALYGVEAPAPGTFAEVTLPEEHQRSGLLGHASFLAKFAHPGLTSPTRRGNFISSRFLCEEVPPPPPGVQPSLPEEEEGPQTMREKLTLHMEDPSCAGCHLYMDPMGLSLEHFDAIGAWRPDDRGLPLDVSGEVDGLGEFGGPGELGRLLHDDERTPRCMVKNFLRASLGHLETSGERYAVRDLADDFVAGGHDLQDLIVELCASPVFRFVGEPK